jgi:hypothetical protein
MKNSRVCFFVLIFLCALLNAKVHTQFENAKREYYLKYSHGFVDQTTYSYIGFNMEHQFKPNWTLNWNLEFLNRKDSIFQLHGSMGLIGGPAFMGWAIDNSWTPEGIGTSIILGLMIMAIPDGVSYHIPIAYRWDLSPYANVLGFDLVQYSYSEGLKHLMYSASAGVRCSYWFTDRFFAKAFVETRKAGQLGWNFGGGLALGWSKPFSKMEKEQIGL